VARHHNCGLHPCRRDILLGSLHLPQLSDLARDRRYQESHAILDVLDTELDGARAMHQPWTGLVRGPAHRDCGVDYALRRYQTKALGLSLHVPQLSGLQVFALLARSSMFTGWRDLFLAKFGSKREFVSLDAKQPPEYTPTGHEFELTKFSQMPLASPPSAVTSPGGEYERDPYRRSLSGTPDYFNKETQRTYTSPKLSFSTPRVPSQIATHGEWDPRSTHARGGLGLHPPVYEGDEIIKETKI